ncbi:toprim domain-containing protein [Falsihalocynthiibacter sp. CO-5D18]|uniref:DUF7146 domain-containing protein n=1 Tax=Falsihalocynthiibacter sp. CO-5D18 TaxID=3240872 RepID=UPI0035100C5B
MDIQRLTEDLGGRWHGSYGLAYCPAHDNTRTPALSLAEGTDNRLLVKCHTGCTFTEVLDALRRRGLIDQGRSDSTPNPLVQAQRWAKKQTDAATRAAQARRLWTEAKPIAGTLAEVYLRKRGITCFLPESLRFSPSCWHASAQRYPALVAMIEGAESFAVHRTYLAPDGTGKAAVTPSKTMLGQCAGGAVRLSEVQGPLIISEGIETSLSLASGLFRGPASVWAALSTSGMKSLRLPQHPSQLTIASDGDKAGKEASYALAERATALGWNVALLPAPNGLDWNDFLKGGAL